MSPLEPDQNNPSYNTALGANEPTEHDTGMSKESESWLHSPMHDAAQKGAEGGIRFQAKLLDAVGQAVIATDPEGKILYWNRAAEELYGWSEEEVMGRSIIEVTPSEDLVERAEEIMGELMAGRSWSGEFEVHRKDGTSFPAMVTDRPMHDEEGNLVAIIGVSTDITEIKKTEEVRRSEEHFRSLVQNASDVITVVDADGTIRYVSPSIERVLGYLPEERIGRSSFELLHPEDLSRSRSTFAEALRSPGITLSLDLRMRNRDGSWRHVEVTGTNLLDEPGVGGIVLNWRDVTEAKRAEETLRSSEAFFRALYEEVNHPIFLVDEEFNFVDVNPYACEFYGYSREEFQGMKVQDITPPEERDSQSVHAERIRKQGKVFSSERRHRKKNGEIVTVTTDATTVIRAGQELYVSKITDITERKLAEETLRRSETSLTEAQRIAHLGNWVWDLKTGEVWWSDEAYRIYGFEPNEFSPTLKTVEEVFHPDDRHLLRAAIDDVNHEADSYDFEHRIVRPDGEVRWIHRRGEAVRGEGGEPLRMIGTVHDITEQKALEGRLEYQAFHDELTGLPNRRLFMDRLKQALRRTRRRQGRKVAVFFMDLDNFKVVNDSLGHEAGDLLLVAVAERLRGSMRPEDTLARFGGDEFAVLVEEVESPEDTVRVAERILEDFRESYSVEGREFVIRPSIGIALGTARTKRPEELLRDADTAMYQAKGRDDDYRVFDSHMYEQALRRLKLESDLRRAIEDEEFVVCYQPIVDLHTEEVWGAEALVRWEHPEQKGLLAPSQFIPVAEEAGLIVPMGRWVLEEACRQGAQWQQEHPHVPPLFISVNLSAKQLQHPDVAETVEETLKETGFDAYHLSLDITETLYIEALEGNTAALDKIKRMGVCISIDDFGTGYSSLAYLKRLPAETLKIDKVFIKGIGEDIEDTAIVRMIIELAHTLGMEVIAEGVESEVQVEQLKEMGCDRCQGFYFAKPLPPEAVPDFLIR